MFKRLLRIARLCDLDDQNNGRFLVPVRPGFPDILQRHRIVVLELRVGAPLDDPSSNLTFRVGSTKSTRKSEMRGSRRVFFPFSEQPRCRPKEGPLRGLSRPARCAASHGTSVSRCERSLDGQPIVSLRQTAHFPSSLVCAQRPQCVRKTCRRFGIKFRFLAKIRTDTIHVKNRAN